MAKLNSLCVYCGSSTGLAPVYEQAAVELGAQLAAEDIQLVYGGGSVGLMGSVARATLERGGRVTGIIPSFLVDREVMLPDVTDLIVTDDMHQRKRLMFENSEAFIALPGGIGTLEELVEMLTWAQLGRHVKPVLIANVNGFWNPLIDLLGHMARQGFIRPEFAVNYIVVDKIADIVPKLREAIVDIAQEAVDQSAVDEAIRRL